MRSLLRRNAACKARATQRQLVLVVRTSTGGLKPHHILQGDYAVTLRMDRAMQGLAESDHILRRIVLGVFVVRCRVLFSICQRLVNQAPERVEFMGSFHWSTSANR
ncbi:hypothetical protein A9513_002130 [Pseudomonas sp. AU12215]|nr:hypothetical protein A9513_002130 [Pseudomonas sp. AU12215]